VGRTYADAPDVDGQAIVAGEGLEPGDLIACEIVAAAGYDLIARAGSVPPRRRRKRPAPRKTPRGSALPILG
jgi:ribosomal protein S12 methylthiotransferase